MLHELLSGCWWFYELFGWFFMVLEAVGSLWNCWVVDDHV
jgi:hypothetical protein